MAKSAKKKSAATKKQTKKNVAPENKEKEIVETKAVKTKQSFDYWKASKIALPIILILIVLAFGWHVRTGSVTLDGLEDNVRANFYSNIQNLISQQVNEEYPNLNPAYKQEEVEKRFNQVLESGKINLGGEEIVIDDLVEQNIDQIKQSFKADNGQTYLTAIDPYFFMRKAENYDRTGTHGDVIINGTAYENKKLAPNLREVSSSPELHVWLESLFLNHEDSDGEKIASIFFLSTIIAILASIPLFFILRKYSNDLFAFFGALLLTSVGTFVSRTVAGFVDTDAYVVLFPLLIILFVVFSIFTENKRLSVVYAIIAGLFQGMFLWAWAPGWFMFLFLTIVYLIYLIYIILKLCLDGKNFLKESQFWISKFNFILYFISSIIFTLLFTGKNIFLNALEGIFGSISRFASISQTNIWPNVFSSVAELNPASFSQIVSGVGGQIIFLIALVGLMFLALDFEKDKKTKPYSIIVSVFGIFWFVSIISGEFLISLTANHALYFLVLLFLPIGLAILLSLISKKEKLDKVFLTILLSVWMAGTIYMSLNGVRFILLLAPAFAIGAGLGLYYIAKLINSVVESEFKVNNEVGKKAVGFIAVSLLFIVLFVPMAQGALAISKNTVPNFDDAWYEAMYNIRGNSSEDAIITSWWDFGHFFATIADRGVTFDGGSQTTPQAHWVGKLLMENDEQVSHDILRMLICGGNQAFDTMNEYVNGTNADAVKINKVIYSTFGKDIDETRGILENNNYYTLSEVQVDKIMSKLACEEPRENFLITSEDMINKAGVWAHWGSWDFTKKYTYENYKTKTAGEIALAIDENESLIEQYVTELKTIDARSKSENIKRNDLINQWFAPYPSYLPMEGKFKFPCQIQESEIVCQNTIRFDMNKTTITDSFQGDLTYRRVLFPTINEDLDEINISEDGDFDVLFLPSQTGFDVMLAQTPLGGSLFTKLYFLNGFGTTQFEKFDEREGAAGNRIIVWKTLWEDQDDNLTEQMLSDLNPQSAEFNISADEVQELIGNISE